MAIYWSCGHSDKIFNYKDFCNLLDHISNRDVKISYYSWVRGYYNCFFKTKDPFMWITGNGYYCNLKDILFSLPYSWLSYNRRKPNDASNFGKLQSILFMEFETVIKLN